MNIFYLHSDPKIAARSQCDKHVVKKIVETAQLLSTAHRIIDGHETRIMDKRSTAIWEWLVPEARKQYKPRTLKHWALPDRLLEETLYRATHPNHPSNIWVRQNSGNYTWAYIHFIALCQEYTKRYDKVHATFTKLGALLAITPTSIPFGLQTPILQAMPDEYKHPDATVAYRQYYRSKQKNMKMTWKNGSIPEWFMLPVE